MCVCKCCVRAKGDDCEAACEAVEAICEVHGVRGSGHNENEERNVEPANFKVADAGDVDLAVVEFKVEPECAEQREKCEPQELWFDVDSFAFAPTFEVENIVHGAQKGSGCERENYKVCFLSVQ